LQLPSLVLHACQTLILYSQVQELTLLIASYMEVFLNDIHGKTSTSCSPS